jgi:molybdopterin-guanine dinucleotide biosynthesis protein B
MNKSPVQSIAMKRIHLVGRRNHGKTTLIVELLEECRRRGIRAGSIKHSAHRHELEPPGKDSYRHRQAGASPAAIMSHSLIGVFVPRNEGTDAYASIAPLFADCELVLVEGDIDAAAPKVEVWRECHGTACLAAERDDIRAIVSDDAPPVSLPVWPRCNVAQILDNLLAMVQSPGV